MSSSLREVRTGFIPLVDCAPLVVARELGFAEAENIQLTLSRETSWASIRDKLAVSHFDVAHILAPMPVASNLGLGPLPTPLIVPMALGTGANSIAISKSLWRELEKCLEVNDFNAVAAISALEKVVRDRGDQQPQLRLGIVHPHSAHHYELAYWLASHGIRPGCDVELVVVPPPLMPAAVASGHVDGFCVGEPWGTVAANEGTGTILTTNAHIWRNSPEKVLGVRRDWAERNQETLSALVRAIYRAARWCDDVENQDELAALLSHDDYVGQSVELIRPSLSRQLKSSDGLERPIDGFLSFASNAATFPWTSQALWFYSQMVRWGQVTHSDEAMIKAGNTYRPDIYRTALEPLGVEIPSSNSKVEGALKSETPVGSTSGLLRLGPDGFFDGKVFDPDEIESYLASFSQDED